MARAFSLKLDDAAAVKQLQGFMDTVSEPTTRAAVQSLIIVHKEIERRAAKRSGTLGKKWKLRIKSKGGKRKPRTEVWLETYTRYAKVQDIGGTMRAKGGGRMTIPIKGSAAEPRPPKYRKIGVKRFKDAFRIGNVIVRPLKFRGRGMKGQSFEGGLEPLFALVKSVTVRGKRYLNPSVRAGQARIGKVTEKEFSKQTRRYKLN